MSDIKIIGVEQLLKSLNELPSQIGVDALRDINKSGADEFRGEMQARAPVGSDGIYKAIKIQKDKQDKTALLVGVGSQAYWARFLEFGTKTRRTKGRGPKVFAQANRGLMRPEPFVSVSIDAAEGRAIKEIFDKAGERFYRYLKRTNKKISR